MATFYETKLGDLYVSSQDNLEFPVHLHALLEIVHVCSGRLTMMIDRQRFVLETGEVGVVFPNQIHGYETDTSNRTELFLFRSSILGASSRKIAHCRPRCSVFKASNQVRALLNELAEGFDAISSEVAESLLSLAFARMLQGMSLLSRDDARSEDLITQAIAYISSHFTQALSLECIAEALHVSKFTLSRQFSAAMGMGLRTYINYLRVDYAKSLLRGTDLPITELAMECGFETPRTFNRSFRELTGETPRGYRGATSS